ncbi:T3SS effector HopA1 family protein [Rhizobium sp. P28RR-XV]|uniref:T3SS effector HopA1 family protein n=1 Tax=Rhizobium sp. P28RR-XV TaxID=2726737 RepID=UPI00145635B3|nr:T3SS effector HopA1 family protein [Rhizobium sp. P28RR-XV]NLR88816.1 hypothetical protein [Rhizobium sp. P28RR-XV]
MVSLHPDLLAMAEAAEVLSPTTYRVLGSVRNLECTLTAIDHGDRHLNTRSQMVRALQDDLYVQLYVRPTQAAPSHVNTFAQRSLVNTLSSVNGGRGGWESGWIMVEQSKGRDGYAAMRKDGVTFMVPRNDIRGHSGHLQAGELCRVRIGKEIRNLMPGYYIAIGDGDPGHGTRASASVNPALMRLYWHLTAQGAVPFIESVTKHLNSARVPFRAKVLNAAEAYCRADAGVLYLERRWYRQSTDLLACVYRDVATVLRAETPMFARPIENGLAAAEDPANGLSFGQDRCHIVAGALWDAFAQGKTSVHARALAITAAMRAADLNPLRPHLGPRSQDCHRLKAALRVAES